MRTISEGVIDVLAPTPTRQRPKNQVFRHPELSLGA